MKSREIIEIDSKKLLLHVQAKPNQPLHILNENETNLHK